VLHKTILTSAAKVVYFTAHLQHFNPGLKERICPTSRDLTSLEVHQVFLNSPEGLVWNMAYFWRYFNRNMICLLKLE